MNECYHCGREFEESECGSDSFCSEACYQAQAEKERKEDAPPTGTWAATARLMAEGDDSGFDWDEWKDRMKDEEMGL